jgi:hypothetical protein
MTYVELLRIRTPLVVMLAIWVLAVNLIVVAINRFAGPHPGMTWSIQDSIQMAGIVALAWATTLGASLWMERDGHLPVAFTKPISRTRYALGVFGVDAAVLLGIFVAASVLAEIAAAWSGVLDPTGLSFGVVLDAAKIYLIALAWFSLMQAFTAGMRSGVGVVLGPAWAVAVPLSIAGTVRLPEPWHAIVVGANAINPLAYGVNMWMSAQGAANSISTSRLLETVVPPQYAIAMLSAIVIAAVVFAINRWQRAEA